MTDGGERRLPHAVLDLDSRRLKAIKIERVLGLQANASPIVMLEVGTGSGGIAYHFANHPGINARVVSVDVVDLRRVRDGFTFILVGGVRLPFADGSFDVVISNHVVEHVGKRDFQLAHLEELRRVLKPGGTGYLAVPNRWMLVEPHYKLSFLSWLPVGLRTPYLRLRRAGDLYDCEPLSRSQLESLLESAGWRYEDKGSEAAMVMLELEPGSAGLNVYARLPGFVKRLLRSVMPTLIYSLK